MGRLVILLICSLFFVIQSPTEVKAQATGVLFSKKAQSKKTRNKAIKTYKKQEARKNKISKAAAKKIKQARKQQLANKKKHIATQREDIKARLIENKEKEKKRLKRKKSKL